MRPTDRARAWLLQRTAPWTVRYGEELRFAGNDLPAPRRTTAPTRHGPVPVHVYRPADAGPGRAEGLPGYVHFHGGAFLMRYPQMDDFWCRYLAAEAGVVVVNVDFSVGPQVRYPVAQEQCHDVAAWVAGDGGRLGVDGHRVAVGGLSSGGGLAASVCLQARDAGSFAPRLQILGVPALDLAAEIDPRAPGMIDPALRGLVRRVYFPDVERRREPYASPLLAPDLSGLPPAVVLTAERDVLRPEGDRYAGRLRAAGVDVRHDVTPGADHYFLSADLRRARTTMAMTAAELRHRTAPAAAR
ncbi:alpha/beta hydrolase fold domain-containing protein [Nocardioides donggukensis]|uniref:Alpha/beta hydrolase fold domain-containing protein n=1 Tax=Nocardioides donggukensis TaxID=2774019 RepID=A0A927Q058_9ACTN|nr:alpha/beta hydrolase fold domain-containing protein [Nocardioides donggukensis]MBD8868064.1 alpha/beta hydrolase fold domain-containing protein [Nocardioides donggukensis]